MDKNITKFPNDGKDLDWVLGVYASEIERRTKYVNQAKEELDRIVENTNSDIDSLRKVMEIVNHSAAISRMKQKAGRPPTKEMRDIMKDRVKAINDKWADLPKEPAGLIAIRNSLEHFENRLDDWSANSKTNVHIGSINVIGVELDEAIKVKNAEKKYWRVFDGENFSLFNDSINIIEVCEWVNEMNLAVKN